MDVQDKNYKKVTKDSIILTSERGNVNKKTRNRKKLVTVWQDETVAKKGSAYFHGNVKDAGCDP